MMKIRNLQDSPAATRVWVLTNAPSPYQAELLTAVAQRGDIELSVRFMRAASPSGRATESRFPFRVMRALLPDRFRDEVRFHPGAVWEVLRARHDCFILSGLYTSPTFLACMVALILTRHRWGVWLERPNPDRTHHAPWAPRLIMSRPIQLLRTFVQRRVVQTPDLVLAIGTDARRAYIGLGADPHRVEVVPYCTRLDRFSNVEPKQVAMLREHLRLAGKTTFLFSGQMIERKGVDTLLEAFERVAARWPGATLVLLGDGPKRAEYESRVDPALRERVHFVGHIDQRVLPAYFLVADVFVFPSRHDGWGVVINEACAAELPIIATHQTGSAQDLVEEGENGFLVERDDRDALVRAMSHFLENPEDLFRFGKRSRELVETYSPEVGAEAFARAVRLITE